MMDLCCWLGFYNWYFDKLWIFVNYWLFIDCIDYVDLNVVGD